MKILELLGKNNKMSYGSLREMLGGINTGKLNYHLRVLGTLVSKDPETGEYGLTDEGKASIEFGHVRALEAGLSTKTRLSVRRQYTSYWQYFPFLCHIFPTS